MVRMNGGWHRLSGMTTPNDVHGGNQETSDGAPPPAPLGPGLYVPATWPRVSTRAIVALVCSFCGVFPIGIVLGYRARREIDRSNGALAGRGVATAAIVAGWVMLAILVLFFATFLVFGSVDWGDPYVHESESLSSCFDAAGASMC